MKTKTYLFALLFIALPASVFAQSDPKATALLTKVSKVYQSYSTINSTFILTTTSAEKKSNKSSGTVWLKGSKYKLNYAGQEIFCNGKFIWTYNVLDKEVTKEVYKVKDNTITPNEIFTIYNRDFKNAYEGPTVVGGKTYIVIKMVPKKTVNYSYIKLEIDQSTNKIQRLIQHFKNGSEVVIAIDKFTPNTPIADTFFEWSAAAHPGVTMVDLTKK
ncbi:MAG: outer membrane lipoprotein carrier protein LolA [Bacteroidetes bacterium]|nr:outer membrane lipoprotein carrier protein LolA [Bacteroidota bacterium]